MHTNSKPTSNNSVYTVGGAIVYGLTILLSALLMFLIEPFVAKLLLPALGGGPNVWNTCVIFFQLILLAGYLYAHLVTTRVQKPLNQVIVHLVLVWVPLLFLPIRAPSVVPSDEHPVLWLFCMLTGMVGILFFAISSTAPLLQRWYSRSGALGFSDPYFLYAASNVGGLLGLLAYPFVLEPNLSISQQVQVVSVGYVCFAVLISICGLIRCFSARTVASSEQGVHIQSNQTAELKQNLESHPIADTNQSESKMQDPSKSVGREPERAEPSPSITRTNCAIWIALAMIPASLFLGLTSYVTSQLSSIPLFWIVPLAIYLISFIIAFGRMPAAVLRTITKLAPLSVLLAVVPLTSENIPVLLFGKGGYITTGLSLHFLALFFVCTACHGLIASQRPRDDRYLTSYYLCLSLGGLLGSCFNTLAAPYLFKGAEEYPLVLLIAGIILVRLPAFRVKDTRLRAWAFVVPLAVLALAACAKLCHGFYFHTSDQAWALAGGLPVRDTMIELLLRFGLPLLACVLIARRNHELRLGLLVIAGFVLYSLSGLDKAVVYRARNFFGCLSVQVEKTDNTCVLWNGICPHGSEYLDPELRGKPVFYFYPDGPIGRVFHDLYGKDGTESGQGKNGEEPLRTHDRRAPVSGSKKSLQPMAVIGLGSGTAVSLASPGQSVVFYEINPQVIEIASNPFYFTYLFQAKNRKVDLRIVQGDGRLEMQKAPYKFYKLIVADVYSSSAIPTHLITKEALQIYLQKLTADGVIAFNITNGYFNLKPVLARAAQELGLIALTAKEYDRSADGQEATYIEWVILSKNATLLNGLKMKGWETLQFDPKFRLWTDDYCNPLGVLDASFS